MDKAPIVVRTLLALTVFGLFVCAFQQSTGNSRPVHAASLPPGAISTIYAADSIESSLNLRNGQAGQIVEDGKVFNHDSHICLGYFPNCFTVGIQGGDKGAILDLGTPQDITGSRTNGIVGNGGNVYVAIDLAQLRGNEALRKVEPLAHALIQVGHIYLVHVVSEPEPDLFVKLMVLDFQPGAHVTFRWQRLDG